MANFFSIGMTKNQVMSKLNTTNVTESTKKLIENFWNSDYDGKVTNENELAMLETWAKGETDIPLPKSKKQPVFEGTMKPNYGYDTDYKTYVSDSQKEPVSEYKPGLFDAFVETFHHIYEGILFPVTRWVNATPNISDDHILDELIDKNSDGFADQRYFEVMKSNGDSTYYVHKIIKEKLQ